MMKLACTIFFLALTTGIFSQTTPAKFGIRNGDVPAGLKAGKVAPGFEATTSSGETISLEALLDKGPVVLIFYRGYWCPHCSRYLSTYSDSLSYLEDLGAQLVAVTPEIYTYVDQTRDATSAGFTIISDTGQEIMEDYNVIFDVDDQYARRIEQGLGTSLEEMHNAEEARLPVPATYIIRRDAKGKARIIWSHFNPDYRNRATVSDMLTALLREY